MPLLCSLPIKEQCHSAVTCHMSQHALDNVLSYAKLRILWPQTIHCLDPHNAFVVYPDIIHKSLRKSLFWVNFFDVLFGGMGKGL